MPERVLAVLLLSSASRARQARVAASGAPGMNAAGSKPLKGRGATPSAHAEARRRLGLDRPPWEQCWTFMRNLLQGNLGRSFVYNILVLAVPPGCPFTPRCPRAAPVCDRTPELEHHGGRAWRCFRLRLPAPHP